MAIFEKFAAELGGGYYCKSGISIADIALFNMVDCHLPLFPLHMKAFPALLTHHKKIQAEQGEDWLYPFLARASRVIPLPATATLRLRLSRLSLLSCAAICLT
eukprot:COSAG02_NODE_49_length_45106_cov_298.436177_37_plen_103_part_00